jgi:hypothetical protein
MRKRRNPYMALVGRPDGKRELGIPRHGKEDNIKIVLEEVGGRGFDRSDAA